MKDLQACSLILGNKNLFQTRSGAFSTKFVGEKHNFLNLHQLPKAFYIVCSATDGFCHFRSEDWSCAFREEREP